MNRVIQGIVHGKVIELREEIGIPDGQEVDILVTLRNANPGTSSGILRSAGVAADLADFDIVFGRIETERKSARFRDEG